jgi:hypothetical protein
VDLGPLDELLVAATVRCHDQKQMKSD